MGSLSPPPPLSQPVPDRPSPSYTILASFISSSIPNWIDGYNPTTNSWQRITSFPGLEQNQILKGFAMASISNSIYIIGGRKCQKIITNLNEVFEHDLEVVNTVWRYNMNDTTWQKCSSLNIPRFDFACNVINNKIYVAGGQCTIGDVNGVSYAELYDSNTNKWTTITNMSTSRYKCVGVTWHNMFIVIGGFNNRHVSNIVDNILDRNSAEAYDPVTNKWNLMIGMWQLDVPPNEIVDVEGVLYSSGDCFNKWKGHIEAYDAKLNLWYEVDGSQCRLALSDDGGRLVWKRLYVTMGVIGRELYFLTGYCLVEESGGGRRRRRLKSVVHVYDTTSVSGGGWRTFEGSEEDGEKELCGHCCVVKHVL